MTSTSLSGLRVLDGFGQGSPSTTIESFRLRPGERPVWIELLMVDERDLGVWRRNAAASGLSVDVWIGLQAEWAMVARDMPNEDTLDQLLSRAEEIAAGPALAPTDELRRWVRFLTRGPAPTAEHDLPSLVIPARLVARLPPATVAADLTGIATEALDPRAVVLERAASLNGMTMEAWAYREVTRLAR